MYWGLRAASGRPLVMPTCDFGPYLNFVGNYAGLPVSGWFDNCACICCYTADPVCKLSHARRQLPLPMPSAGQDRPPPSSLPLFLPYARLSQMLIPASLTCLTSHPNLPPPLQCNKFGWLVVPLGGRPASMYEAQRRKFGRAVAG